MLKLLIMPVMMKFSNFPTQGPRLKMPSILELQKSTKWMLKLKNWDQLLPSWRDKETFFLKKEQKLKLKNLPMQKSLLHWKKNLKLANKQKKISSSNLKILERKSPTSKLKFKLLKMMQLEPQLLLNKLTLKFLLLIRKLKILSNN